MPVDVLWNSASVSFYCSALIKMSIDNGIDSVLMNISCIYPSWCVSVGWKRSIFDWCSALFGSGVVVVEHSITQDRSYNNESAKSNCERKKLAI